MLSRIPQGVKGIVLLGLGRTVLVLGSSRNAILTTDTAPWGIVSLELARSEGRATQIVQSWNDKFEGSLEPAFADLLFDCLVFIPLYVAFFSLGCFWTRDKLYGKNRGEADRPPPGQVYMSNFLIVLGWFQFAAAGLDYAENGAMWVMLRGPISQPWPAIAALCATLKFVIILAALPYAFVYAIMYAIRGFFYIIKWPWRRRPGSG